MLNAPTPLLDLADIETRATAWLADPYWVVQPTERLIGTDVPALVARVRALDAEVARLEACLDAAVGPKGSTGWW